MAKENCQGFDVIFGIDMETDIGSFTPFYNGVKHGTGELLSVMKKNNVKATFFWTGHAAENNPKIVKQVKNAGHETGCHGLYHETLGDPLFPLPNNWPVMKSEVEGRIKEATKIVRRVSGVKPKSFRCPRLWGSTQVVKVLEKLGYVCDASLPLYFYRTQFVPYKPSSRNWAVKGKMNIVEIPNFCDLTMETQDPKYQRDRDQWPLFRTKSANAVLKKMDGFIDYVSSRGHRPVVCFYFHPWEFWPMPKGYIDYGEAKVKPASFIVKNCGPKAVEEFYKLCQGILKRNGSFKTAKEIAHEYI